MDTGLQNRTYTAALTIWTRREDSLHLSSAEMNLKIIRGIHQPIRDLMFIRERLDTFYRRSERNIFIRSIWEKRSGEALSEEAGS